MDSRQVTSALQQWPGLDGKSGKRTRHLVKVPKDQKELLDAKENWANNLINNAMPPDIYPRKYGQLRVEAYRRQGNPTPPMGQGEQPNSGSTASPQKCAPGHQMPHVIHDEERTPDRNPAPIRNGNTPGDAASTQSPPPLSWTPSPDRGAPTRAGPAINVQAASSSPHEERSQESARDLAPASPIKRVSVEKLTESRIDDADSSDSSDGDLEIQQPMRMHTIARVSNVGQYNQTPTSAQAIIPSTDPSSMLVPSAASAAAQHPMRKISPADMSSAPMASTSALSIKPSRQMIKPNFNMPVDMLPTTTSKARSSVAPPPANLPPSMSIDSYATPEERIPASSVPVADMGDIEVEESPRQPQLHSPLQVQPHPESKPEPEARSLPRKPSPPQAPPARPTTTKETLTRKPSPQLANLPMTPYEAYAQAYPKYQGGLDGFILACAYIEALNSKIGVPGFLFDDIIRAIHEGYIPYTLSSNILNPGESVLSAWSWYSSLTNAPQYHERIITTESLATVLDAHANDLARMDIMRAPKPQQRAASARQEALLSQPPSEPLRGSSSQELVGSQLITEDEAVMTSNEDEDEGDVSPEDDENASSSSEDDDQETSSQRGASDDEMEDVPPTTHEILSRTLDAETPHIAKEKNAREASFAERTESRPARGSNNELMAALARPSPVDEDNDAIDVEAMDAVDAMDVEPLTADFEYGFQTQDMEDEAQVDDWTRKSPRFNMSAASSRASSRKRAAELELSEPVVKRTRTVSRTDRSASTPRFSDHQTPREGIASFNMSATSSRASSSRRIAEPKVPEAVVKRTPAASRADRSASTKRFSDHRTPRKSSDKEGQLARASSAAQESRAEVNVSTQGVPSPILGRSMSHSTSFNSAVSHQPSAREPAARPSPEFIKPAPKVPRAPSVTPSSTLRKRSYTYMEDDPSSSIRSNRPEYKDETPDQRRKRRMRELIEKRKSKGSAPSSARSSMGA